MNTLLRQKFKYNSWNYSHGFLEYLRAVGCFSHMNGDKKANPFWWGSLLEFNTFEKEIKKLIESRSIKLTRLKEFASLYVNEELSPIVRLTGLTLNRIIKSN